ncbi:MAG: aminoacyl-histidine dipeptidase [Bacteroidota bacterium]|nr:aminoacyl-histidine dipeptidase [Bacteroidota bacterium]
MNNILDLPDHPIWDYFSEILQIPRASGKEEKILAYLKDFAQNHNLAYLQDKPGNLLIKKEATKGKENLETVILQSHIDMVCEKNMGTMHDFDKDPIQAQINDGWIKADGTTLGADDGIGVASQLAILASTEIEHGTIECLFTVDEESGMTGAMELGRDLLTGKILLNLDSEDEGELFIGCAGGIDTLATYEINFAISPGSHTAFKLFVNGLKGGHSGDEIQKGLGNSIKILNRILWEGSKKFDLKVNSFRGGNLRNAIPREAFSIFVIPNEKILSFQTFFTELSETIENEYSKTDPDLHIQLNETDLPGEVFEKSFQDNLLSALYACPHGALSMSHDIEGLVESSTNLASVKQINKNTLEITTSQRSSVESAKTDISQMVESVFILSEAEVKHSGSYPGWTPNTDSIILGITRSSYEKLFGNKAEVKAIHAGLECGLFLKKYPELDMISFGPTIKGAHSPDERLHIESTYKFWDLLLEVLKLIPEKK